MFAIPHRFTQHVYTTNVFSPIPVGVPILRLLAVDDDIGTNALLKFSITGGNSGGHFSIDSVTGVISSGQSFASDKKSTFSIDVEVSDSGLVRTFKDQSKVKVSLFLNLSTFCVPKPKDQLIMHKYP